MKGIPGSQWFFSEEIREDSPVRLFCFAGDGDCAADFQGWSDTLNSEEDIVECFCAQLPGAGPRSSEQALVEAEVLIDGLVTEIIKYMEKPFAFIGRSLGIQVVLALALELESRGLPLPWYIMISNPHPTKCEEQKSIAHNDSSIPPAQDPTGLAQSLQAFISLSSKEEPSLNCPITGFGTAEEGDKIRAWGAISQDGVTFVPVSNSSGLAPVEILHPPLTLSPPYSVDKAVTGVLSKLVSLSRQQSLALINSWNSKIGKYPDTMCVHDMFRESAARYPQHPAIIYKGTTLTFGDVDVLTDDLANWLYDHGVRVGSPVGIFMERSTEFSLAYIAALKSAVSKRLPQQQKVLCMDTDGAWKQVVHSAPPIPADAKHPTPDDLAYIVMSSGTTGAPKGICCPHRGAVHSYHYRLLKYPYSEGDREACNVFFVWEQLRPLLGGMVEAGGHPVPLYIIPDDYIYDPSKLLSFLGENRITRMLFTPSLLQLVLDTCSPEELQEGMKTMRIAWLCGEVVTVELRNRFAALVPHCRMENLYSISECHDISFASLGELDVKESPKYAPCGKVIPNVKAYILDEQFQQVPVGVPGRMFVAGPTLALGYLNLPEKTAERFVPDPFGAPGERMYDTGDRCRYLPSGSIEVLGRCDFMVKVRGYSVVVGAVEAAIAEHPLVSTSCVLTEGEEGSMDKKLVAYVVPERWEKLPSVMSIQAFLKTRLPPYSVPHVFILLDALPINLSSGKTDRKRMPKTWDDVLYIPFSDADDVIGDRISGSGLKKQEDSAVEGEALRSSLALGRSTDEVGQDAEIDVDEITTTERAVKRLWACLLDLEETSICPSSDFFDLGGHSLLLARLSSVIRTETGVHVPMQDIVENSTLRELAQLVEQKISGKDSTTLDTQAQRMVGKAFSQVLPDASSLTPTSDFFDLGGHSLLLASLSSAIKEKTGVSIEISDILENPALWQLAKLVEGSLDVVALKDLTYGADANGSTTQGPAQSSTTDPVPAVGQENGAVVDLVAEAGKLDQTIFPAPTRKTGYSRYRPSGALRPPYRVLLTGATGFLGAHLLVSLLKDTPVEVYCLVRAQDENVAWRRLQEVLERFGFREELNDLGADDRIVIVPGNLSKPLLGLSHSEFQMLAGEVDAIIHNGAAVNLVLPYRSLKAVNVLGTQEVLRLAVTNTFGTRVKPVHYISSSSVFPFSSGYTKTFMEDAEVGDLWRDLKDGYSQSKWVAERMCVDARTRGLPCCLQVGCVPEDLNWQMDMTPVNFAARAIVHVTVEMPRKALGKVLHVQNPQEMVPFQRVVQWLRESTGAALEGVPMEVFRARIAAVKEARNGSLDPEGDILQQLEAGLPTFDHYLRSPGHLDCSNLISNLKNSGIHCPALDKNLIATYATTLSKSPEVSTGPAD